jgi:hypothetical protein
MLTGLSVAITPSLQLIKYLVIGNFMLQLCHRHMAAIKY